MRPPRFLSLLAPLAGALVLLLGSAACQTRKPPPDYEPAVSRFLVEASPDEAGIAARLPASGTVILTRPKPLFVEYDVANVELVRVDLGLCLQYEFLPQAARDLYRFTLQNRGRRLVLTINGVPVGARLIDQPIANGAILIFVELREDDLPRLVHNLRVTTVEAAKDVEAVRKRRDERS